MEKKMKKLINLYRALPTLTNRAKLKAYMAKHPMALCLISEEDANFLRQNGF
jgi:hypothetical protein